MANPELPVSQNQPWIIPGSSLSYPWTNTGPSHDRSWVIPALSWTNPGLSQCHPWVILEPTLDHPRLILELSLDHPRIIPELSLDQSNILGSSLELSLLYPEPTLNHPGIIFQLSLKQPAWTIRGWSLSYPWTTPGNHPCTIPGLSLNQLWTIPGSSLNQIWTIPGAFLFRNHHWFIPEPTLDHSRNSRVPGSQCIQDIHGYYMENCWPLRVNPGKSFIYANNLYFHFSSILSVSFSLSMENNF